MFEALKDRADGRTRLTDRLQPLIDPGDQPCTKLFTAIAFAGVCGSQGCVEGSQGERTLKLAVRRANSWPFADLVSRSWLSMHLGLGPRLVLVDATQHLTRVE